MKIIILSENRKFSSGPNSFFPLYKWRANLLKDGFEIEFHNDHRNIEKKNALLYIVSSRYPFKKRADFITLFSKLKNNKNRVALWDDYDTSGMVDFDLIGNVDGIIKKQVLKDLSLYTVNNYDLSVRPWLLEMPHNPSYLDYTPCPKDQLYKIKVGWNIGLCDYRYLPFYSGVFRNYITTNLPNKNIKKILSNKDIFTTYRGNLKYGNNEIAFQRKKVMEILNAKKISSNLLGNKVSLGTYFKELERSKVSISPFGWGEICYRDFEIMYNGGLLIKPSMDHLITFPDIFIADETYIKIRWDITDLYDTLDEIDTNPYKFNAIAINAYEKFMDYQNNYERFSVFFRKLINSI